MLFLRWCSCFEDDVVRLEVEHPEVGRCPPHPEVLAVVDLE